MRKPRRFSARLLFVPARPRSRRRTRLWGSALDGINAEFGVLGAYRVLHILAALVTPRLDRVHIRELQEDDTIGRRIADQADGFVVAAGKIFAAMIGDVTGGGL